MLSSRHAVALCALALLLMTGCATVHRFPLAEPVRVALTAGAENNATRVAEAGEHTARLTVRLHPDLGAAAVGVSGMVRSAAA